MKREDIEFLRDLQHELNTQEHDGQAAPRYWGICQTHYEIRPIGYGDELRVAVDDMPLMTKDEFKEYLDEHIEDFDSQELGFMEDDIDTLVEYAENYGIDADIIEVAVDKTHIGEDSNVFLTKRAAQEHIKRNHYHYDAPRTYAMTAWRNPEFEHLMRILQTMNIDEIPVDDGMDR